MKRLILLLLLFPGLAKAADCISNAPFTIPGSSIVCVWANSSTGVSNNMQSGGIFTHTFTTGNSVVVSYYMCTSPNCVALSDWQATHPYTSGTNGTLGGATPASEILPASSNPCGFTFVATTVTGGTGNSGGSRPTFSTTPCQSSTRTVTDGAVTWTALRLQLTDQNNVEMTCFSWSPSSPQALQNAAVYENWISYCPNITSATTKVFALCSVNNSCSFVSAFWEEYSGMCTVGTCFDVDAASNGIGTTMTATTAATSFTNELVIAILGTVHDEALTAGGGCVQVDQQETGNLIEAKYATTAGAQSCTGTWTGSDTFGILIATIKSAASSGGTTGGINAASCNQSDVNKVINGPTHTAIDGDIINIPAGSCNWGTTGIVIPSNIGITIRGTGTPAGSAGTIGASSSCAATQLTFTVGPAVMFTWNPSFSNSITRLSCMEIITAGTNTNANYPLSITGNCSSTACPNMRFDNLTIPSAVACNIKDASVIGTHNMWGVLDHNTIGDTHLTGCNGPVFVNVNDGNWLGVGIWGDNSWATPDTFGTNQTLFIENNLFKEGMATDTDDFSHPGGGGRVACRFNTINDINQGGFCTGHGTDTGGRLRGGRQFEIYYNTATCGAPGVGTCGSFGAGRSGVLMVFSNQFTDDSSHPFKGIANFDANRRWRPDQPWGACDGSSPWDQNVGTVFYSGTIGSFTNSSGLITTTDAGTPNWTANSNSVQGQWVDLTGNTYSLHDTTQNGGFEISNNTTNVLTRLGGGAGGGTFIPANNDAYQILRVPVCLDQSNRGAGLLVQNGAGGDQNPVLVGTGNPGSVAQALDPSYQAGDTVATIRYGFSHTIGSSNGTMIANRDFYAEGVGQPAQTSPTSPFRGVALRQGITSWVCAAHAGNPGGSNTCSVTVANTTGFQVGDWIIVQGTQPGTSFASISADCWCQVTAVSSSQITYTFTASFNDIGLGAGGIVTTVGTGHGTLANRPTTCTPSVGYWATDQGTWNKFNAAQEGQLFICTSTNTWTLSYTPFTYPHPLITGGVVWLPSPNGKDYVNGGLNGRSYNNGINGANGRRYP